MLPVALGVVAPSIAVSSSGGGVRPAVLANTPTHLTPVAYNDAFTSQHQKTQPAFGQGVMDPSNYLALLGQHLAGIQGASFQGQSPQQVIEELAQQNGLSTDNAQELADALQETYPEGELIGVHFPEIADIHAKHVKSSEQKRGWLESLFGS